MMTFAKLSPCSSGQSPEAIQKIQTLIQQGNTASAQMLLSQMLKEFPSDANLYNLQGVVMAQEGNFAGSEASFKRAIRLASRLEDAYINLGHLYQELIPKDAAAGDKAIDVYAQLLSVNPGNLEANYQSAFLLMRKGLYQQSLKHLSKLPTHAQERSQALSVRCGDSAGLGEEQKAEEVAEKMMQNPELKPHDPRGRLALGSAYFNCNDFDKARGILLTLVHDPVTTAVAYYYLGKIANREGDYIKATQDLQLAIKTSPSYTDAYAELGVVRLKQKEYPQAEEAFQKALKLNPDNYTANLNLLILYQRTQNPKAAEQAERFNQVKEQREQREKESLRTIEVRP